MRKLSFRPGTLRNKSARYAARSGVANADEALKGLGGFLELFSDMEKKGEEKTERTGEIKLPDGKAMYGFSVKIGGEGIPKLEHFGNIVRETEKGTVVEKEREPVVDVHEEEDRIEVIVELPGVMEKTITHVIKDDVLILNAGGNGRKYCKEVQLPDKASVLKTTYKNGIYRLILKKEKADKKQKRSDPRFHEEIK
jgi:HSP20 family protein